MTNATRAATLTEFLLARIDEDEDGAHRHAEAARNGLGNGEPLVWWGRVADRVLAECEAKRRIVEVAMPGERDDAGERFRILRALASVYSDHPDYRDEWRP